MLAFISVRSGSVIVRALDLRLGVRVLDSGPFSKLFTCLHYQAVKMVVVKGQQYPMVVCVFVCSSQAQALQKWPNDWHLATSTVQL